MDGFLNLHKPSGLTSHDCVIRVRKLLHIKRVGHAGTLDPAATGVLPIALGRATRLLQFLTTDKVYEALIRFGYQTSTDDLEGEIIRQAPPQAITGLSLAQVQAHSAHFLGKFSQIPPQYSAIQVDGQRLYHLARTGQTVEVQPRWVQVFDLQILDWIQGDYPELRVTIACSAGTYIRSIARDWGERVQTGATLAQLIRTQSCGLKLCDSLNLSELQTQIGLGQFQPIHPETVLAHLPQVQLTPQLAKPWCHGQPISINLVDILPINHELPLLPPTVRVHLHDRTFLGIGKIESENPEALAVWGQRIQLSLIPQVVFMPEP
ncbi:MAG: tRNA pseudouridine(55) synthase TruB [Synechococcales cyanobacterium]